MLNLEKIYAHRSGANRDIRKAVERGLCEAGTYKAKAVDGGFQIQLQATENEPVFAEVEVQAIESEAKTEYAPEPIPPQQPESEQSDEQTDQDKDSDDAEKFLPKVGPDAYVYYSTQRPIGPGTHPGKPVDFVNYERRMWVVDEKLENGEVLTWGYLVYDAPLEDEQVDSYELVPRLRASDDNTPANSPEDNLPKKESKAPSVMSETQATILDALITSEAVEGNWIVMQAATSGKIETKSLPGATRGLLAKGYIKTEWGKDDSGKKVAIATVTEAGCAALKAS